MVGVEFLFRIMIMVGGYLLVVNVWGSFVEFYV